jgi:hypothetical protein
MNYEKLEYTLDIRLKVNEYDLKLLDYYFGKIENDLYSAAEAG